MSTTSPTTTTVAIPAPALPSSWSLADLQHHLGDVPLERIRMYPPPGLATLEDALRLGARDGAICEVVDGVLVEKPMGSYESLVAMMLGHILMSHVEKDSPGIVLGEQGTLQLLPAKMRIPDVSFIRWDRFPGGKLPDRAVYEVAPDLAVEIISAGNTDREMELKLDEYFHAGVRLVWYIYPKTKTAYVYTARNQRTEIDEQGILDGGEVLPGFQLRLGDLFDRAYQSRG